MDLFLQHQQSALGFIVAIFVNLHRAFRGSAMPEAEFSELENGAWLRKGEVGQEAGIGDQVLVARRLQSLHKCTLCV